MLLDQELLKGLNEMQRNFSDLFNGYYNASAKGDFPLSNFKEADNEFKISVLLPGVKPDDVDITFDNGVIIISGEKKSDLEKERRYIRQERLFGKFSRSFKVRVPIDPEKIKANYKNGILEITLTKSEEAKPVKIKID